MTYALEIELLPEDPIPNRRLGRHKVHDSRSKAYAFAAEDIGALTSIRHMRIAPVFDQGRYQDPETGATISLGSCTGNASLGALGTEPLWNALGKPDSFFIEATAVEAIYVPASALDPFPGQYRPEDTGSDGLSVAKVLQANGWISGYQHALSLEAALTALSKYPVITGVPWMTGMDNPDVNGLVHATGSERGGHEFVADELDVERRLVGFTNSWGLSFGVQGRFYMSWDDWGLLLAQGGDVTILLPLCVPSPVPVPVVPTPAPVPTPAIVPSSPEDVSLALTLRTWLRGKPLFYKSAQRAALKWLEAKGL